MNVVEGDVEQVVDVVEVLVVDVLVKVLNVDHVRDLLTWQWTSALPRSDHHSVHGVDQLLLHPLSFVVIWNNTQ